MSNGNSILEQYQHKPSLNSVLLTKSIAESLRMLFESRAADINQYLQLLGYMRYDGSNKPLELAKVYIGVAPDRKKIPVFPAISIFVASRNPEWWASRITKDTVNVRIFCCVQNTENELAEKLMYDFTEICTSILFSVPTLPLELMQTSTTGSSPKVYLHRTSTSLPQITYGSLNDDYIRAGQIDWVGEVLLNHPDMLFL
jgi:hypothetical protein